jgi:NACalpha-BTF3-like transcription factor
MLQCVRAHMEKFDLVPTPSPSSTRFSEHDISQVMSQTGMSKADAIDALEKSHGNIVDAINSFLEELFG